jgi:hypothetical protein
VSPVQARKERSPLAPRHRTSPTSSCPVLPVHHFADRTIEAGDLPIRRKSPRLCHPTLMSSLLRASRPAGCLRQSSPPLRQVDRTPAWSETGVPGRPTSQCPVRGGGWTRCSPITGEIHPASEHTLRAFVATCTVGSARRRFPRMQLANTHPRRSRCARRACRILIGGGCSLPP